MQGPFQQATKHLAVLGSQDSAGSARKDLTIMRIKRKLTEKDLALLF